MNQKLSLVKNITPLKLRIKIADISSQMSTNITEKPSGLDQNIKRENRKALLHQPDGCRINRKGWKQK